MRLMNENKSWKTAKKPFDLNSDIRKSIDFHQIDPTYSFTKTTTLFRKTIGLIM